MERKKNWKSFQDFEDARADYRRWLYCGDPEEKALWKELLNWENQISDCAVQIRRTPMPTGLDDVRLPRASLHIKQKVVLCNFVELLFETSCRKNDEEAVNLLFSFLKAYSDLLSEEAEWCQE